MSSFDFIMLRLSFFTFLGCDAIVQVTFNVDLLGLRCIEAADLYEELVERLALVTECHIELSMLSHHVAK